MGENCQWQFARSEAGSRPWRDRLRRVKKFCELLQGNVSQMNYIHLTDLQGRGT